MATIDDYKEGQTIESPSRGKGTILKVTPRTITIKWKYSTEKKSFNHNNAQLELTDF